MMEAAGMQKTGQGMDNGGSSGTDDSEEKQAEPQAQYLSGLERYWLGI
jgi:hypothetical protein